MTTHSHFKSYVPGVTNADEISDRIGYALHYQYMFERKTSPWEMSQWDPSELRHFEIDLDRVDRLYHINSENEEKDGQYFMLARMEYQDARHVFVELDARCDSSGFDCQGDGSIYLTMNPNLFSRLMNWAYHKMERLYQCLAEDGYSLKSPPLSHDIQEAIDVYCKENGIY